MGPPCLRLLALSCPESDLGELTRRPHVCPRDGTDGLLKIVRLCLEQQQSKGHPTTCSVVHLQAVHGYLWAVLCWLVRPGFKPGPLARKDLDGRCVLLGRPERIRSRGPA